MKKNLFISFLFLIQGVLATAQNNNNYGYDADLLPGSFFKERRELLREKLPENAIAVLFSNPIKNRANDVDYDYHQDPNFYYLTGFREPNAVIVILKNKILFRNVMTNEILFISDRDEKKEIWTGRKAGIQDAAFISSVSSIFLTEDFINETVLFSDTNSLVLSLQHFKGIEDDKKNSADLFEIDNHFQQIISKTGVSFDDFKLKKILASLREIKTQEELKLIAKSVNITCEGFREMMKKVQLSSSEYQIQAEGEYVFKKLGAEMLGYSSICGSSENSCILHYTSNRRPFAKGDLVLLDMGAEYHGYSADVTRTIPISGKFSNEQKLIYELVLKAQNTAINECQVGNQFKAPHEAAVKIISNGLVQLGIIKDPNDYKTYFMHSTSHYLGLDVHDPGNYGPLSNGNVITVEPGIYIPENSDCDKKWWNIGVRIEDDILIRPTGPINLSELAPRNIDEIEKLTSKNSFINK